MKTILSAVVGATLVFAAIQAGAQVTPGERQVALTIETDTLAAALDKWAQQADSKSSSRIGRRPKACARRV